MGIPPIIAPDGSASCPIGYILNDAGNLCVDITTPITVTTTGAAAGQSWTVNDISAAQVDPKTAALLGGLGTQASGILDRFITGATHALLIQALPLIRLFVSAMDTIYGAVAEVLTAAQSEATPGFFTLSAGLVSDLFGVAIDPATLAQQYASGGRLASVSALGASIVNILAAEFMNVYQSSGATGYNVPNGAGVGGLPVATMSPEQGVRAAQAFLGFATEFGVREGNAEMIASMIPGGYGEGVREMAVAVARGVNLSRMGRVALMPLFRDLVATPLQWAINKQYHPTLLTPEIALAAEINGDIQAADYTEILDRLGYSDTYKTALDHHYRKVLPKPELDLLHIAGLLNDQDYALYLGRGGYDAPTQVLYQQAVDLAPARKLSLAYLDHVLTEALNGKLTEAAAGALLDGVAANNAFLISPGEMAGARKLISLSVTASLHQKKLPLGEWKKAFLDGLVTLGELETAIAATYADPNEQQIYLLQVLFDQGATEVAQAALAKRAATFGITLPGPPKL